MISGGRAASISERESSLAFLKMTHYSTQPLRPHRRGRQGHPSMLPATKRWGRRLEGPLAEAQNRRVFRRGPNRELNISIFLATATITRHSLERVVGRVEDALGVDEVVQFVAPRGPHLAQPNQAPAQRGSFLAAGRAVVGAVGSGSASRRGQWVRPLCRRPRPLIPEGTPPALWTL